MGTIKVQQARFSVVDQSIPTLVVQSVLSEANTHLFQVAQAHRLLGVFTGALQSWQENGDQQGNDADDHQQFDQREPALVLVVGGGIAGLKVRGVTGS
jgi:hypothetical protein